MIMGYDMFRNSVRNRKVPKELKKRTLEYLLDAGPDLVVCDEGHGHTLKNEKSAISVATMKIRTRRRILLTGTPLQNNLTEYHCMVQFIKPNLLGNKTEFKNRFVNPITNGQFANSTSVKIRSHVLHKLLDGIVQGTKRDGEKGSLFKDYQIMRLIWTHPFALHKSFEKRMKLDAKKDEKSSTSGSDDDDSSESEKSSGSSVISIRRGKNQNRGKIKTRTDKEAEPELEIDLKAGAWWRPFITDEDIDNYKQGPKLVLLFAMLRECELNGDKVLVFCQSISSLDMIEHFLKKTDEFSLYGSLPNVEKSTDYIGTWKKNTDYFRLDGSTRSDLRRKYTNRFNECSDQRARLFLISTRAGGLGMNLQGANRVVLFDASWNPSFDVQSIFRVYRLGQTKPCYIYRFLSQGTMEEKIYERQVTKLSISCRVVDEQQIDRHFSRNEMEELYTFVRKSPSEDENPKFPKDDIMTHLLRYFKNFIVSYHEHDSLLENIVDEELTEEERKSAWEQFHKNV